MAVKYRQMMIFLLKLLNVHQYVIQNRVQTQVLILKWSAPLTLIVCLI